jgi:CO/xanthine dehydrogenase Mo-binding subunit
LKDPRLLQGSGRYQDDLNLPPGLCGVLRSPHAHARLGAVDTAAAAMPGAPAVWDECPDNVSNLFEAGDKAAADAAFARAAHVVKRRYAISRVFAHYVGADTMCNMQVRSRPVPTKLNPMGAKGAGEAGTVGALPAVMNAVVDALAPQGVRTLDMPATSEKIWRAIRSAKA